VSGVEPSFAEALRTSLAPLFGTDIAIERLALLAGGASKEAWALDLRTAEGMRELLVRRAGGGVIHSQTLPLEREYRVVAVAHEAGVRVPRPYAFLEDVAGRPAFVAERVVGETIGRRIVQRPELASARAALPEQMAEELAKIHAISVAAVAFLPAGGGVGELIERLERDLDAADEAHPAIELGLAWARRHPPDPRPPVVDHGDFRVGNFVVSERGLEYVLDWEFAHVGDPAEDLAWPLVRSWRFGADELRLGGVGQVEPYLARYNELTDRDVSLEQLRYWEVVGNVKWAIGHVTQSRRHLSGQERSVELAVLGRLTAEVEYELLDILEREG
jgi:aminoglycoside phosphotransferase (APT) family kinase protein